MRAEEATLFSDATFTGGLRVDFGPYGIYNLIGGLDGQLSESLALKYSLHLPELSQPDGIPEKVRSDSWLGLSLDEEIAALLSLFLSVRLRSGGVSREFAVAAEDPAGLPVAHRRSRPVLTESARPIIPRLTRLRGFLGDVPELMNKMPTLSAAESVALVRAARQYQMAIWVVDSDPELCWLQLISAVEVAATHWRGEKLDAVEVLNESYPEIADKLGEGEVVAFVARRLQKLIGSTRRFTDFMEQFDPGPPEERCEEHFQIPWSDLRRRLRLVYGYRSGRLHAGEPFPPLMNESPMILEENPAPIERPFGVAHFAGSSHWPADALPMHLWFFERLVQGALVRWYQESLGAV